MKSQITVLRFGGGPVPRALRSLRCRDTAGPGALGEALDEALDEVLEEPLIEAPDRARAEARRLVVIGADTDLATVLTGLLRADRLDVEVAHAVDLREPARLEDGLAHATRASPTT